MTDPSERPGYRPGGWLVNPAYFSEEAVAARPRAPRTVRFIDATLSEGDDCVGHQLNWLSRLELAGALDDVGVDEITLPSHARYEEELDFVRAYRRAGCTTPLVAKGPGIRPPLTGDWRAPLQRHLDLGVETISPIVKWSFADVLSDFAAGVSRQEVLDGIAESISYLAGQGARVVPWIVDSMRMHADTVAELARAAVDAGADGVYLVDSRGNSVPAATAVLVGRVRDAIGDKALYVQHHNDLGVATANALASVEAGADTIDVTVLGIGDRGGCVALEEIAPLVTMYGYETGVRLDGLYELGLLAQRLFGVPLAPWKPVVGASWNKEEGVGHLDGSDEELATCGIAPSVVGRAFEGVIGAKLLFGRERSSITEDDHRFLRSLLDGWGLTPTEEELGRIVDRTRAVVATTGGGHVTVEEFRRVCAGVLDLPEHGERAPTP